MSEPKQAKPTEHADRGCVLRLADALYDVVHKADLWESAVHVYEAEPRPRLGSQEPTGCAKAYERAQEAKEALRRAVEAAVAAIPGTDWYVRQMRETKPGEWSSKLKADLRYFGAELIAHGDSWLSNAPGPYWAGPDPKEVANKDRDYRTWWHAFHEEQKSLRNMDVSALEPAREGSLPRSADDNAAAQAALPETHAVCPRRLLGPLILWAVLLVVLWGVTVYCVWRWEQGNNLWQQIRVSWLFFGIAPAMCLGCFYFHAGKAARRLIKRLKGED